MTVEAPPAQAPDQRRRALRVILGAVLVLAFVAGVGYGYYRWSHPTAFSGIALEAGYDAGGPQHPAINSVAFGASSARETTSVEVIDARPVVSTNSSRATLRVVVCTIGRSARAEAIGTVLVSDLPQYCSHVVPARGATMRLSQQYADQLVLEVTPHRAGVVFVHGLDVTYHHGWQRGTQHLGVSVKVTTP